MDTNTEVDPAGVQASEAARPAHGDSRAPSASDHVGYDDARESSSLEHPPLPTKTMLMTPAGRSTSLQENRCPMCRATFSHKSSPYRHAFKLSPEGELVQVFALLDGLRRY